MTESEATSTTFELAKVLYEVENGGRKTWPPENTQVVQAYIDEAAEIIVRMAKVNIAIVSRDTIKESIRFGINKAFDALRPKA